MVGNAHFLRQMIMKIFKKDELQTDFLFFKEILFLKKIALALLT